MRDSPELSSETAAATKRTKMDEDAADDSSQTVYKARLDTCDQVAASLRVTEQAIADFKAHCDGTLDNVNVSLILAENTICLALTPSKSLDELKQAVNELVKLTEEVKGI